VEKTSGKYINPAQKTPRQNSDGKSIPAESSKGEIFEPKSGRKNSCVGNIQISEKTTKFHGIPLVRQNMPFF